MIIQIVAAAEGPPAPGSWLLTHGDIAVFFGAAAVVVAALIIADRLLKRRAAAPGKSDFGRQVTMVLLTLVALVVLVVLAPMQDEKRTGLITLFGIAITAAIGLSSTTILSNAMAGLLVRSVGKFRPGDFVRVGEHFGRVTERSLFHTELQTEFRDLTTLPNFYIVSNPVTVVRSSGTVVYATVSLGYDVHEDAVRAALLRACENAGLTDGFVHITELGDFSVTYRVAGFLADVKLLISARSELRRAMLHALHDDGIEIVSPTVMLQRPQPEGARIVPARRADTDKAETTDPLPERVIFDKAERAEVLESLVLERTNAAAKLKEGRASLDEFEGSDHEKRRAELDRIERRIAVLDKLIERAGKRKDEDAT